MTAEDRGRQGSGYCSVGCACVRLFGVAERPPHLPNVIETGILGSAGHGDVSATISMGNGYLW